MPPVEYMDLVLIPGVLHTPTVLFRQLPQIEQLRVRKLLQHYLAAGWGGNLATIKRDRFDV